MNIRTVETSFDRLINEIITCLVEVAKRIAFVEGFSGLGARDYTETNIIAMMAQFDYIRKMKVDLNEFETRLLHFEISQDSPDAVDKANYLRHITQAFNSMLIKEIQLNKKLSQVYYFKYASYSNEKMQLKKTKSKKIANNNAEEKVRLIRECFDYITKAVSIYYQNQERVSPLYHAAVSDLLKIEVRIREEFHIYFPPNQSLSPIEMLIKQAKETSDSEKAIALYKEAIQLSQDDPQQLFNIYFNMMLVFCGKTSPLDDKLTLRSLSLKADAAYQAALLMQELVSHVSKHPSLLKESIYLSKLDSIEIHLFNILKHALTFCNNQLLNAEFELKNSFLDTAQMLVELWVKLPHRSTDEETERKYSAHVEALKNQSAKLKQALDYETNFEEIQKQFDKKKKQKVHQPALKQEDTTQNNDNCQNQIIEEMEPQQAALNEEAIETIQVAPVEKVESITPLEETIVIEATHQVDDEIEEITTAIEVVVMTQDAHNPMVSSLDIAKLMIDMAADRTQSDLNEKIEANKLSEVESILENALLLCKTLSRAHKTDGGEKVVTKGETYLKRKDENEARWLKHVYSHQPHLVRSLSSQSLFSPKDAALRYQRDQDNNVPMPEWKKDMFNFK